jgi:hypothetical protein
MVPTVLALPLVTNQHHYCYCVLVLAVLSFDLQGTYNSSNNSNSNINSNISNDVGVIVSVIVIVNSNNSNQYV